MQNLYGNGPRCVMCNRTPGEAPARTATDADRCAARAAGGPNPLAPLSDLDRAILAGQVPAEDMERLAMERQLRNQVNYRAAAAGAGRRP